MFTRTWDAICAEFETLNLNWNPANMPVATKRHWYSPSMKALNAH
jgi:hypothetical protein